MLWIKTILCVLLGVGWTIGLANAPEAVLPETARFQQALERMEPDRTEVYQQVAGQALRLHIFQPQGQGAEPVGCVLWFHGGGWDGGTVAHLYPHARYFSELGLVNIVVEYRLAKGGNSIATCVEDANAAFAWVQTNAAKLGVDAAAVVVAGESAGGHLAAMVALEPAAGWQSGAAVGSPAGVVMANPVLDLTEIPWALNKPPLKEKGIAAAKALSPQLILGNVFPPTLLLHGGKDTIVPPQQSEAFAAALHERGSYAQARIWPDKGHSFMLYLPEYDMTDLSGVVQSLIEIEAFLLRLKLPGLAGPGNGFVPLYLFGGPDGYRSFSELVVAGNRLLGSTYKGGPGDHGTLFSFDPKTGKYQLLRAFSGVDGREVFNGFALADDVLFGACKFGGKDEGGTLFAVNTDGSGFRLLHQFARSSREGFYPHAAPVLVDGVLFGATYHGGDSIWGGAIYAYPLPDGPYQVIHSFKPETGRHPCGQLVAVGDWLYGTASDLFQHGSGHFGSLFRLHRETHAFELLHRFDASSEGSHPFDRLYFDGNDRLIGTTLGEVFNASSKGTVFSFSIQERELKVLHDFAEHPGTGSKPNGSLITVEGESGFLYGLAHGSNVPGGETGTAFRIRMDGSQFTVLHHFDGGLNGNTPMRNPVWFDGALYGVAAFGGLFAEPDKPETGGGLLFRLEL